MDLEKCVALFDDGLGYHELAKEVRIVDADLDVDTRTLEFVLAVPDVADWSLRYRVLKVAQQFEDEHHAAVHCLFRAREDLATSVR